MAEDYPEKFNVPPHFDCQYWPHKDDKVCVVSIIGKSHYSVHHSKASFINPVIDTDVFLGSLHDENCNVSSAEKSCQIEGHYDTDSRVIYLHLRSAYDASTLANLCQKSSQKIIQTGHHAFWQTTEELYARALLFLFSVSHIIVLVHPGNSFDVNYVRLFRILDTTRVKFQPCVTDLLRGLPISKDWIMSGRPCSPRVLFVFESSTIDTNAPEAETMVMSKSRSQKTPPIKRLQHAIEDQIYRILRKSRVITNISNYSLFAVPANQEFVFVSPRSSETTDPVAYYLTQLRNNCSLIRDSDNPKSRSYQTTRRTNQTNSGSNESTSGSLSPRASANQISPLATEPNSFKDFLWQHIELAQGKGFDDNVGRNPVPSVFELSTSETWFVICSRLYDLFLGENTEARARTHFKSLQLLLHIDLRFSESRCAKVLPLAERAYQEGLPQHYTKNYHINKLAQAKQVFSQHARGPACDKYLRQLEADCQKLWQSGRQLCEEVSLTGSHCINELHRLAEDAETEENKSLPVMPHSSQVKMKATCNCGRKQNEREDPFDHKTANFDFYQKLESICCDKLKHYDMPVFEASTDNIRPGRVEGDIEITSDANVAQPLTRKDSTKFDMVQGMSNLSLALSLGQSGGSDVFGQGLQNNYNAEASQESVVMATIETSEEKTLVRQHSTTEYLPGMIHGDNPSGLLPMFPSWSLVCLGTYSSYSPSQGVDQSGFLHCCNFLLPWDVNVKADQEKWPSVSEMQTQSKKTKNKKGQKVEGGEVTLRFYLGFEYECPRGHRFFLSSPDKIFKAPTTATFKETAGKILSHDMPLYFPCHCRSSKGYIGQLMRVFVVIPEGPAEVHLKPKIQPARPPCPLFHPGTQGPIILTAGGFWVLRLPYVYISDNGPLRMPSDPQLMVNCKALKGMISIVELPES